MAIQEAAFDNRNAEVAAETFDTIVIGGGQAGLAVGYYLKRSGRSFVVLDGNERIGGSWRTRTWSSLRLFTPARYDGLPGWPFPSPGWSYPTAREAADYLEAYAARFELPVRTGMTVDRLAKDGDRYIVEAGESRFEAGKVVVATGFYGTPSVPGFAGELDPHIVQMHSSAYRDRGLRDSPDLAFRQGQGTGADPHREPAGAVCAAGPLVRRLSPAHGEDAARPQGPATRSGIRCSADQGESRRSRGGRRRVCAQDGRSQQWAARPRGRAGDGRRE